MTTFQDLPPQSRRSARQSERGENPDTPAGFTDFTPQNHSAEPESPEATPHEHDPSVTTGSHAFEVSSHEPDPVNESQLTGELPPLTGRRARPSATQGLFEVPSGEEPESPTAAATPPVPGAEPLEYMTQGRDLADSYRAPEPQQPPQPQFRVRDFSPEGRASGRRAAVPPALIEPEPPVQPLQLPTDLDYRTHVGPAATIFPAPVSEPENYPEPVRYIPSEDNSDEPDQAAEAAQAAPAGEPARAGESTEHAESIQAEVTQAEVLESEPQNFNVFTSEPAFAVPVTAEPASTVPVTAEPAFAVPITAEPAFAVPITAEPAFVAPFTAEPAFAGPITTEPAFDDQAVIAEVVEEPAAAEDVQPEAPAVVASPLPQDYPFLSRRELRARLAQEEATRAALLTGPQPAAPVVQQDAPPAEPLDAALVTAPQDASLITGPQDSALLTGPRSGDFPAPPQRSSLITGSLLTGPQPPAPTTASIPLPPPPPAADSRITDASVPTEPPASVSPFSTSASSTSPSSTFPSSIFTAPPASSIFTTPPAPSDLLASSAPDSTASASSVPASAVPANVVPTFMEPDLEHTGGWAAPVGHWSRQADLDDESQPWENTLTREVGGGNVATTTSALVLPEMPLANPFPSALTGTGEILLTGSIDLPRSLSSGSGDSRHFDDTNVDLMYDTPDSEIASTDSAPVSAIRAVSTHTSARGVISSKKPQGNRMLTVLLVTASVMAVGVVILLVAGLMGNVF